MFGPPVVEENFGYIRKSPAVLHGPEPEIPIFQSSKNCPVVSAVLFPDRTTVQGGGMDEVPVQQFASVKRADTPVVGPGPEALRIPVDNTNLDRKSVV